MKTLLFAFLVLLAPISARALDLHRQVEVIALCETGAAWDGIPGRHGELSDWQITEAVWLQHMFGTPFSEARNPAAARACALKHIRWLVAGIERHGYTVTPARVATAWNIGLTAALRRRCRPTPYGNRAANLYYSP